MAAEGEMPIGFDFFDLGDTGACQHLRRGCERLQVLGKINMQGLRQMNRPAPITSAGFSGIYCSTSRRRAALPFNARR